LAPPQTYETGYIISSDAEANKYLFFKSGYFDPAILQVAEQAKQPVTEGEILTLASVPMMNNFARPVKVIDGGTSSSQILTSNSVLTRMQITISLIAEATVVQLVVPHLLSQRWSA
jgi:hypothetical protein